MTIYTFQEVAIRAEKSGKCVVCGKPTTRREKFYQTLNPYNRNAAGVPKSRSEIYAELGARAAEWRATPVMHLKCEEAERQRAREAQRATA